jgi:hypothetical protein
MQADPPLEWILETHMCLLSALPSPCVLPKQLVRVPPGAANWVILDWCPLRGRGLIGQSCVKAGGRDEAAAAGSIWHERQREHDAGHRGQDAHGAGPHGLRKGAAHSPFILLKPLPDWRESLPSCFTFPAPAQHVWVGKSNMAR